MIQYFYKGGNTLKKIVFTSLFMSMILFGTSSYASSYVMHTAQSGDSYWKISQQYNVSIDELKALNNETDDTVEIGDLVKVMPVSESKTITIKVDDKVLKPDILPYIEDNRAFVPIRFIAKALNVNDIAWDNENKTAILADDTKRIELTLGSSTAKVNGKVITLNSPVTVYEGRTFVPVRFVAEVFECLVSWDHENYSVLIDTLNSYSEDIYWLSRIVHAESEGEPYEGKLAVANVIINRKNSSDFPSTIKGVIFDTNYGYQYTPAQNGTIYNTPSWDSIKAATEALEGNNNIADCQYFLNPDKSTNFWILENKTFYKSIGLHDFYR